MLPGLKQGEPRSLPGVLSNQNHQDLTLSHQNQQAEACKEGCKTPRQVMENFLCMHRNLPTNKQSMEMIYLTYLKLKPRLKNIYEMTVKRVRKKERRLEFVQASREDSFSNLVPSEALEDDLQKLSTHKHIAQIDCQNNTKKRSLQTQVIQ